MVLLASPALPVKTLKELIAYARANPGKINYASGGNGALSHLSGKLLKTAAKIDLVHVPYKGSAPANIDLMGGQVQIMFQSLHLAAPYIASGKLVPLGVASLQRCLAADACRVSARLQCGRVRSSLLTLLPQELA